MHHRAIRIASGAAALLSAGCSRDLALEDALNAWLRDQYPEGHPPEGAVDLGETPPEESRAPIWSSQIVAPTVEVSDPDAVTAFCIGFGDPADGWCIPMSDPSISLGGGRGGVGTATAEVSMPPELCAGLSEICHDITCYEFAETSAGVFTEANIEFLAAACGGCDEPSCQSLLDECSLEGFCLTDADCPSGEACVLGQCVGGGALQFTLTWATSGTDLDLYVQTPDGPVISYQNPSAGGGVLDHDDLDGGPNSIENISFEVAQPGTYTAWVNVFSGSGGAYSLTGVADGAVVLQDSGSLASGNSPSVTLTY